MSIRTWLFGLLIVAFAWGLYADYSVAVATFFAGAKASTVSGAGSWGDTFGAFTALVSTAGTFLVVATLRLQQIALRDQQAAFSAQLDDTHRERFESSFFELLRLLRQLRDDLSYSFSKEYVNMSVNSALAHGRTSSAHSYKTARGYLAIRAVSIEIRFWIREHGKGDLSREDLGGIYMKRLQDRVEASFSPYFRMIYTILDRLRSDTRLTAEEKYRYSNLLRSHLTSQDIGLIAVNSTAPIAKDLFDLLVEFRMLKYLPPSSLERRIRKIFPSVAFEART